MNVISSTDDQPTNWKSNQSNHYTAARIAAELLSWGADAMDRDVDDDTGFSMAVPGRLTSLCLTSCWNRLVWCDVFQRHIEVIVEYGWTPALACTCASMHKQIPLVSRLIETDAFGGSAGHNPFLPMCLFGASLVGWAPKLPADLLPLQYLFRHPGSMSTHAMERIQVQLAEFYRAMNPYSYTLAKFPTLFWILPVPFEILESRVTCQTPSTFFDAQEEADPLFLETVKQRIASMEAICCDFKVVLALHPRYWHMLPSPFAVEHDSQWQFEATVDSNVPSEQCLNRIDKRMRVYIGVLRAFTAQLLRLPKHVVWTVNPCDAEVCKRVWEREMHLLRSRCRNFAVHRELLGNGCWESAGDCSADALGGSAKMQGEAKMMWEGGVSRQRQEKKARTALVSPDHNRRIALNLRALRLEGRLVAPTTSQSRCPSFFCLKDFNLHTLLCKRASCKGALCHGSPWRGPKSLTICTSFTRTREISGSPSKQTSMRIFGTVEGPVFLPQGSSTDFHMVLILSPRLRRCEEGQIGPAQGIWNPMSPSRFG